MGLLYEDWINELKTNEVLKKEGVDKIWFSLVGKKEYIQKQLFDLLYEYKDVSSEYSKVPSSNPYNKTGYKRYYTDLRAWKLIKKWIPELKNQAFITDVTADNVFKLISWIRYCEEALDSMRPVSDPTYNNLTSDLKAKRSDSETGVKLHRNPVQLELFPDEFPVEEQSDNQEIVEEVVLSGKNIPLTQKQIDKILEEYYDHGYDEDDEDDNEFWWQKL